MPDIVALLPESLAQERLHRAYRVLHAKSVVGTLHDVNSWQAAEEALLEHLGAIAVVDPYFGGLLQEDRIARLVAASPSDLIVYSGFHERAAADVLTLRRLGVRRIATIGVDDSKEGLCTHVLRAIGYDEIELVLGKAEQLLSEVQLLSLRWAMRLGWMKISVADFAMETGVSARTLSRWWRPVPMIATQALLRWATLLHACRILSRTEMTVSAAAHALGFPSSEALRRAFKKATGGSLRAFDRERLWEEVAKRFLETLACDAAGAADSDIFIAETESRIGCG